MSEAKLYAVKNDKGQYLNGIDSWGVEAAAAFKSSATALGLAEIYGGHIVALIEEPKKVVVSPEEAEFLKNCLRTNLRDAFLNNINLLFRGRRPDDINRLKSALTNGYTVEREKKYLVYKELGGKQKNKQAAQACRSTLFPDTIIWLIMEHKIMSTTASDQFTESEIEHYGLQDCEKEEVTDDGIR